MEKMVQDENEEEVESIPITEESLISNENLDRASPDLWPESNVDKFNSQQDSFQSDANMWSPTMSPEDVTKIFRLGNMNINELIAEVKKLHDSAYQLGLEEAKEMTRGKYLSIFKKK